MIRSKKIVPAAKLFFGFEDLDIELKIKKSGYRLLVSKELFLRHWMYYNRMNLTTTRSSKKPVERLWREYYSIRSLLYILWNHRLYAAFASTLIRAFYKIAYNFRFGFSYGRKNAFYLSKGILHFLTGTYGKTI